MSLTMMCYILDFAHGGAENRELLQCSEEVVALIKLGLILHSKETGYSLSERALAYVELLRDTPLPIQVWADPRHIKQ